MLLLNRCLESTIKSYRVYNSYFTDTSAMYQVHRDRLLQQHYWWALAPRLVTSTLLNVHSYTDSKRVYLALHCLQCELVPELVIREAQMSVHGLQKLHPKLIRSLSTANTSVPTFERLSHLAILAI